MQQQREKRDVIYIKQHILVHLIPGKVRVKISEAEKIGLSKVANKLAGVVCGDSTYMDFMKTVLNFFVAFKKEYNKSFVAVHIVDVARDVMSSNFLTAIRAQYNYRYILVARKILRHGSVCARA